MIHRLFIKNFAIINALSLPMKKGLTVVTGETGSGKSLILKSMGITLGGNGDKTDVRSGEEKAIVEVELTIKGKEIEKMELIKNYINSEFKKSTFFFV